MLTNASAARTTAARQSIRAWSASVMVKPARRQQPRAQLEGLEVRESCLTEWLAAGGDRRSRARVTS